MNHSEIVSFILGSRRFDPPMRSSAASTKVILPLTVLPASTACSHPTKRRSSDAKLNCAAKVYKTSSPTAQSLGFCLLQHVRYDFDKLLAEHPRRSKPAELYCGI